MGISGDGRVKFKNNIDNIFCDGQEIRNLYGNKPSFLKIYRGIKYLKKNEFSFKPPLSKNNTNRIIVEMENSTTSKILRGVNPRNQFQSRIHSLSQNDESLLRKSANNHKTNNSQYDYRIISYQNNLDKFNTNNRSNLIENTGGN
jgi:hypothetical protein